MSIEKYSIKKKDWQFENQRLNAMLRGNLTGFQYSFDGDDVRIVLFW